MKYTNIEVKPGVYEIVNLINNKRYIGSTNNFLMRFKDHKNVLNNNKSLSLHLQNAVNKYGIDNFEFRVLAYCTNGNQRKLEQWYLDNEPCEYNIDKVVIQEGCKSKNRKFSDEEVQKIRWLFLQGYLSLDISKLFKTNRTTIHGITSNIAYVDVIGLKECPELVSSLRTKQTYHFTKVNKEQILDIRKRHENKESPSIIYKEYGISDVAFYKIVNKVSYKHIN